MNLKAEKDFQAYLEKETINCLETATPEEATEIYLKTESQKITLSWDEQFEQCKHLVTDFTIIKYKGEKSQKYQFVYDGKQSGEFTFAELLDEDILNIRLNPDIYFPHPRFNEQESDKKKYLNFWFQQIKEAKVLEKEQSEKPKDFQEILEAKQKESQERQDADQKKTNRNYKITWALLIALFIYAVVLMLI